jgi:hypothetical protein
VARVTARVVTEGSEDDLVVSMFDHGGSAGGYENTWGTGKLYFESMKVKNCRIHNRPAYNSEVHSSRDMGVDELNYAYKDYTLTDTIFMLGANSMETQTNLYLNHMVPGLQGGAKMVVGRSAAHADHRLVRAVRRQGERPAPGDQRRHGPGALQRHPDPDRRSGLDRRGLHRGLDLPGRRGRGRGRGASRKPRQPRARDAVLPHVARRGGRDLRRACGRHRRRRPSGSPSRSRTAAAANA